MNVLEEHSEEILGKDDICAKMTIDDLESVFLITDVMRLDQQYTLSFWLKSETPGAINICDVLFNSGTEWSRHQLTFTAERKFLELVFERVGVYYIYHMQLESGSIATDWQPAPEDMATEQDIVDLGAVVQQVQQAVLNIDIDKISSQVSDLVGKYDAATDDLSKLAGRVSTVEQTAGALNLSFQKIETDGVARLDTTTGYTFDEHGMMVDCTDSPTKTQLTFAGLFIKSKTRIDGSENVLTVTESGVDAANLLARTYLIVGRRSRFENYGSDQTGCFWIGG